MAIDLFLFLLLLVTFVNLFILGLVVKLYTEFFKQVAQQGRGK